VDRIDALRLYLDVTKEGSFSKVARKLSIATSTVTLALTQLEQELGANLIIRSTRQLGLTHEGEMLKLEAQRLIDQWDNTLKNISGTTEGVLPLKITASNDFGHIHLRKLLDEFQTLHRNTQISLILSDNPLDLISEKIDIAIRSGPLPDSNLKAKLLLKGKRLICASPTYWREKSKPSHPSDLLKHNCLILARPGAPLSSWPFKDGDKLLSVKVSGDREATSGEIIREWALDGYGVALKNYWDIKEYINAGLLETSLDEYNTGDVDLFAVFPNSSKNKRVNLLADFLVEKFKDF
jgi:DNA-binding transcriptional LysR family regulator